MKLTTGVRLLRFAMSVITFLSLATALALAFSAVFAVPAVPYHEVAPQFWPFQKRPRRIASKVTVHGASPKSVNVLLRTPTSKMGAARIVEVDDADTDAAPAPTHGLKLVDTERTRIRFNESTWYDQFLEIRSRLGKIPTVSDDEVEEFWTRSNGYSLLNTTDQYAVGSNMCATRDKVELFFKDRSMSELRSVHEAAGPEDFYWHMCAIHTSPLDASSIASPAPRVILAKSRQMKNIFHTFGSLSLLMKMVLHPNLFPTMNQVMTFGADPTDTNYWGSVVARVLLDTFPPGRRPVHVPTPRGSANARVCSKVMVVLRSWSFKRTWGSYMPEMLGSDMLRAAAYRYAGVSRLHRKEGEKLIVTFVRRLGKRRILNEKDLLEEMRRVWATSADLRITALESVSPINQIRLFSEMDVFVTTHGAGVTNVIFMVPKSSVVELMPPHWTLAGYKRMSKEADLFYQMVVAEGERGPECANGVKSLECSFKGTRDRDFVAVIPDVIAATQKAHDLVCKHKYGR